MVSTPQPKSDDNWRVDDSWFVSFQQSESVKAKKKKSGATKWGASGVAAEDLDETDDDEGKVSDEDIDPCPDPCPSTGCAAKGSGKAASNALKRRHVAAVAKEALPVPFGALRALQSATDQLLEQGVYPAPDKRSLLQGIGVGSRTLSEGDVVRVAGYLSNVRRQGPESVNCKLKGAANNDIHLSVVENEDDTEFAGFVAEVIPQKRPKALEAPPLAKLSREGVLVMVVGPLFYDAKHFVNAGPQSKAGQPKRFTLWEIHPVSQIYVCPTGDCDVRRARGWERLGDT